jgi:soluble lytic murein transglycosylase-like protein
MARAPQQGRIPTLDTRVIPGGVPETVREINAGGAGAPLAALADRIASLGQDLNRRADFDVEDAAWEAGTVAGEAEPGIRMEGGGRVFRTAYNRAAADAGARRLEIMARQEIDRLAQQHRRDPDAFTAAAAAWRDGMAANLPSTLAARFRAIFDLVALPEFQRVRQAQQRAVADQAVATFFEALPARLGSIELAARQALTDPASARSYRAQEDQTIAELIALGPREAFQLNGRHYPADPSRAAALSLAQIVERAEFIRQQGREAVVIGAWRAAGGGQEWIDNFERRGRALSPDADWLARNAAVGQPLATPERLAARVPAEWRPIVERAAQAEGIEPALLLALVGLESGGRAGAVSPAGAIGPAQIMPATAANPGFGMEPLPREALTDPARAIPWAARYLARLRDHFGGDMALALAAYNRGPRGVEQDRQEGRLLPQETRNYLATLLPAAGGGVPLPDNEVQRIAARLRGLHAADQHAIAQERATARAELTRQVHENLAAISVQGRPVRPLDPDLIRRAGEDPLRLAEQERAAIERYAADQVALNTTDPEELRRLAESVAPGTPNFRADPTAAVQLRARLEARGVQIADRALDERVRDLDQEAQATGRAGTISAEEARAAGVTPERRDEINRQLALTAELARLRDAALRMPPGPERDAALAALPVEGPEARENALRLRAMRDAFKARDEAIQKDPAGFALAISPGLRSMATEVQQQLAAGDASGLPAFAAALRQEQARLGVPADRIQALPDAMQDALVAAAADARDPVTALAALRTIAAATGLQGLLPALSGVRGPQAETRREAMAVAAAIGQRDPALARRILAGTLALRETPMIGVTLQATAPEADREFADAFRAMPAARAQIVSAATALYAAEMNEAGKAGQPFDARRFRAALRTVQPMTDWGSQRLPLPPGMSERDFTTLLSDLPPQALAGAHALDGRPITPAMVARGDIDLLPVGAGLFELRRGAAQVLGPAGQPFRLDVTAAAALPRPSALRTPQETPGLGGVAP